MPDEKNRDLQLYGDVSFGDLLQALAATTVGDVDACRRWAMELLGLPLAMPTSSVDETGIGQPQTPDEVDGDDDDEQELAGSAALTKPDTAGGSESPVLPYKIVRSQRTESSSKKPAWLTEADDLPAVSDVQVALRPPLKSLFRPVTTRALLSTAFSTPRGEGDIDIDEILDCLTSLRPLTILPRLPLSTLRLGLQLLIDRGQGTWPFYGDQEHIHGEILDVVGRDRVETLYFSDCPLRGLGPGSRRTWALPYEPPPPGTPVVVLSDLGIGRRRMPGIGATRAEWSRFAQTLCDSECPLLALVPYGPGYWPAELRQSMYILHWDRSTSISVVRRLVGDGLVQSAQQ